MSEINLKDYQIKLDALFKQDQYDEVILHCRHILQTYPKNVNVYRFLGRSLVALGRYDEAAPVLRRVLSVFPADYHANLGLSRVYRAQRNVDAAIWHLERAFEQDPNNKTLLDDLRDLYTHQRGSAPERLQLTARAVAEQQIRSGLYHRAVDTLRAALRQSPERIDLEILLAQTYWQIGQRIDAGETALNVLKRLPDSLDANRIMTELWLAERRPSDAQRYLSRIEAVGPYTAFQIAQGEFPPDDAFKLQELDYQREASRQLTSDRPEWLDSLVDEDSDEFLNEPDLVEVELVGRGGTVSEDDSEDLLGLRDQEWLQDVKEFDSDSDARTREVITSSELIQEAQSFFDDMDETDAGDDDDWLADLDEPFDATAPDVPTPARKATGLTGLLATLEGDTRRQQEKQTQAPPLGSGSGLTDLLGGLDDGDGGSDDYGDDAGLPADEEPYFDLDTLDDDDDASDPLAWMQDAGIDLVDAQMKQTAPLRDPSERAKPETEPEPEPASQPETGTDGFNDPLAWMRGTDIEIVEQAQDAIYDDPFGLEDDVPITDPGSTNPLAWMERAGVELIDDATPTRRPSTIDSTEDLHKDDRPVTDPLAWLKDSGIEFTDDDQDRLIFEEDAEDPAWTVSQAAWFPETQDSEMESGASADNLGWLTDDALLDEMLQMEELSQTGSLPQSSTLQSPDVLSDNTPQDRQNFMVEDHDARPPDWLSSADDDEDDDSLSSPEGGLEWLDDDEREAGEIADEITAALDWMTEPEASAELDEDDAFAMGMATDTPASEPDSAFTWEVEEEDESSDYAFADTAGDEDSDDDAFAWNAAMFGDSPEDEADVQSEIEADESGIPDWLSGVGAPEQEETISPAVMPDWLSGVGAASLEASSSDEEEAEDSFDFLNAEVTDDADDLELAFDVDVDTIDSDLEPDEDRVFGWDASVASVSETSDDDLFGLSSEQDAEFEEEPAFSWLSNVENDEDDAEADYSYATGTSSMMGEADTDDNDGLFVLDADDQKVNVPDWLSGVTVDDAPGLDETAITEDDEFELDGVLNTVDDEDDVPDWLADVGASDDDRADELAETEEKNSLEPAMMAFDVGDDDEDSGADQFNWMSDVIADDEDGEVEESEDELMGMMAAATAFAPDADVISADDDDDADAFSWLTAEGDAEAELGGIGVDEDEELEEATIPDWLSGVSVDADDDRSPTESDEFTLTFDEDEVDAAEPDWLTSVGMSESEPEQDEAEEALPVTSFMVDDSAGDDDLFASYDEDLSQNQDDEFAYDFDELDDVSAEEMPEEVAAIPADNAPEWLNEMVPGLDLDYADQDEDEPLEHEYLLDHPRAGSSREFAWLTSIVDEELAPPTSLPPAVAPVSTQTPVVAKESRTPRFVFSRQPAWLRRLLPDTGKNRTAATLEDKDEDLPPWLNLDDED